MESKEQKIQDQSSTQENTQDLDQNQHVEANPSQVNFQNVQVHPPLGEDLAGKITGITYSKDQKQILPNVKILLYFGTGVKSLEYPVYKTQSDEYGNFSIKDLPPGYYTLEAYKDEYLKETLHTIKVMIGQTYFVSVFLENKPCKIKKEKIAHTPLNTDYFLSKL